MQPITLYDNPKALSGTCYFEFLPGEYKGDCWNSSSVFLDEETFGFIEPIFIKRVSDFDHYSFVSIDGNKWKAILSDLTELRNELASAKELTCLRGRLGMFFKTTESDFESDFDNCRRKLIEVIDQLITWLEETLEDNRVISVLGL